MRIAILGSLTTTIPPTGQSSVERLAFHQTVELAKRGHHVTLCAPIGSRVEGEKITVVSFGVHHVVLPQKYEQMSPEEIFGAGYKNRLQFSNIVRLFEYLSEHQKDFDVILSNFSEEAPIVATYPGLTTPSFQILHVPIIPQVAEIYQEQRTRLISISHAQRRMYPNLNYVGNVYNGVDTDLYTQGSGRGDYVLYLGSIGPNKNPRDAILAAKKAGVPIMVGGKVKIKDYYEREIAPYIDGGTVRWVGELIQPEVIKLYQNARAFLFPTLWDEPFGLVAIEAMACGTPVVAYGNGAVPEVVADGVTGFIVEPDSRQSSVVSRQTGRWIIKKRGVEGLVEAITRIGEIDRRVCRRHVEEKFSVGEMAKSLEEVFLRSVHP